MLDRQTVNEQWPESATAPTQDGDVGEGSVPDESKVIVQTTRLGRFMLLKEIGSGGMGTVFAAYDEQLDRKVALKILRKPRVGSARQRLQILREARAAARISHPNVVSIYEVNEADGLIHIAMEYVEGETLLKWQAKGGHQWRDILGLYLQVGMALQAAHDADVVHRDFKPDNVLIGDDGRPRVVDFGLARVGSEDLGLPSTSVEHAELRAMGRISLTGVIAGTLGYMSPEQYRGGNVDARSDQWSFCASLFEALYGVLPFAGKTMAEYAENVYGRPRPRPSNSLVPEEVHSALLRGLNCEPDKRFSSMAELMSALSREHSDDIASGVGPRRLLVRGLIGIAASLFVLVQFLRWNHPLSHREPILVSLVMISATLTIGLARWRTLLSHRVHRNTWILLLVVLVQNFVQRILAWSSDIPRQQMIAFEMIVIAGALTIGSVSIIRRFYWLGLVPLACVFVANAGLLSPRLGNLVYLGSLMMFLYGWSLSASEANAHREKTERISVRSVKSRRTPSMGSVLSSSASGK